MEKSKYVTLLRSLSSASRKEFEQFFLKQYSKKKEAVRLFKYIKKFESDFKSEKLQKKQAFYNFYNKEHTPGKEDRNFLNLLGDLHKYLKNFLLWKMAKENTQIQENLMFAIYENNELHTLFFKHINKRKKELSKKKEINSDDLYQKMKLNEAEYYHSLTQKLEFKINPLLSAMEALDHFYILNKLKYSCELYNRANVLNETSEIIFLSEIKSLIDNNSESFTLLHRVYLKMLNLITDGTKEKFIELKRILSDDVDQFENEDLYILISCMLNYAATQVRSGNQKYSEEAFELDLFALDREIFLKKGLFTDTKFQNIVDNACAVSKIDWAKTFIDDNINYFPVDKREDIKNCALSKISFEEKDYDKSIQLLLKIKINNDLNSLRVRTLLLRNYFETEHDTILKEISNFEKFIYRNRKVNQSILESGNNFLRIFKYLYLKKTKKKIVVKDLKESNPILLKTWLNEKVKDYKCINH